MKPVTYTTIIRKFGHKGEKTGWTYVEVPAEIAMAIKPGHKAEFKVKGKLDRHPISRTSLLPMGGGNFILPLNAELRRAIGKRAGATLQLTLQADDSEFVFNPDLIACLQDEPAAWQFFRTLPGSHQRYFSKWIDSAKTEPTRTKRIAMAVNALSRGMGYAEMIRASSAKS